MAGRSDQAESLSLLFTCVGRRIELLQAFRAAAERLDVKLRIVGVDSDATAPGLTCADEGIVVPRVEDAQYVPALMDVVARHGVAALIPTADTDLLVISRNREAFGQAGCLALIGEPGVISMCRNKLETYRFLQQHGIDTPATYTADEVLAMESPAFPLFSKPRTGSASQRVNLIGDRLDLEYFLQRYDDLIVQEYLDGQEYTLDVYVGLDGVARCVVPRVRWQVRTGEVSRGVVVKDRAIMEAGKRVVDALGRSPRGIVTLQCIVTADGRIRFIEINPRFGGGAPLGIAAGADYPAWLMQELRGEKPEIAFDGFRHGLCMLRYDWSLFVPLEDDLKPRLATPLRDWPPFS